MSRGLGRRELQLLRAVYDPDFRPVPRPGVWPRDFAVTASDHSALQRAARSLVRKGLVRQPYGCANDLVPLTDSPISVQKPWNPYVLNAYLTHR